MTTTPPPTTPPAFSVCPVPWFDPTLQAWMCDFPECAVPMWDDAAGWWTCPEPPQIGDPVNYTPTPTVAVGTPPTLPATGPSDVIDGGAILGSITLAIGFVCWLSTRIGGAR